MKNTNPIVEDIANMFSFPISFAEKVTEIIKEMISPLNLPDDDIIFAAGNIMGVDLRDVVIYSAIKNMDRDAVLKNEKNLYRFCYESPEILRMIVQFEYPHADVKIAAKYDDYDASFVIITDCTWDLDIDRDIEEEGVWGLARVMTQKDFDELPDKDEYKIIEPSS